MPDMYTTNRSPLTNDWNQRRSDGYDVVVIGSGYGAAVTAARLATAQWPTNSKPTICILERGREWLPSQFPDTLYRGVQESRSSINPLGLYDNTFSRDIGVLAGSGLGGTSLINANVAIRPDSEVFERAEWPQAIRTLSQNGQLTKYYDRARATLFASQHPNAAQLSKVKALKKGAQGVLGAVFEIHDIAVNFNFEGVNNWGVQQRKCINCGDCTSGCNVGAKNTLDTNYLAIAKHGGTEIFTQVECEHLTNDPAGGYLIHYLRRESSIGEVEQGTLRAKRMVIVGAGSLGSTALMLRSRRAGLSLPDSVGKHFGSNGDFFGVAYNTDQRTDDLGWGAYPESNRARRIQPGPGQLLNPGPSIVSRIRYNTNQTLLNRFKAEDFSIPSMYVNTLRLALAVINGHDTDPNDDFDNEKERKRRWLDFIRDPQFQKGALNHTLAYLVSGHDNQGGVIELDPVSDGARMKWPGAGQQTIFQQMNQQLQQHITALGGTVRENPLWGLIPFRTLATAHPLGGCVASDSHTTGTVNHVGQVYQEQGNLHTGLYITDAATIPTSLGVNPFLTISALAEWRAEHLITSLGGTPVVITQI